MYQYMCIHTQIYNELTQCNIRVVDPHPPVEEIGGHVNRHIVNGPWGGVRCSDAIIRVAVMVNLYVYTSYVL
jgi:hypothetical protein